MSVDRQRDFYDGKSTEELRVLAERRGIPRYKTELFVGDSLREYLRAWDRDREDLERWFGVPQ